MHSHTVQQIIFALCPSGTGEDTRLLRCRGSQPPEPQVVQQDGMRDSAIKLSTEKAALRSEIKNKTGARFTKILFTGMESEMESGLHVNVLFFLLF